MSVEEKLQTIVEFPEVRVVEASAGSGKTYALASRYIQLLLNPSLKDSSQSIRSILALTFTNKAAFEMKSRILEFLKSLAFKKMNEVEVSALLDPIGISEQQASDEAFKIMDDLIRHYNFFQVQTIDKFINALLSGCAFKIGLTANFRIRTNVREYLQYSLDDFIDRAADDAGSRQIFEYFLQNYLYLENRTGWFPKEDLLVLVCDLFYQHTTYGFDFKQSSILPDDLIKLKTKILVQMHSLKEQLPEKTNKTFIKAFDKFLKANRKGFDIDSVPNSFLREDVYVNKGCEVSDVLQKSWEDLRVDLRILCEMESVCVFNPAIQIFNHVFDVFKKLSSKNDVLFLPELNKKASFLFDDDYVTVQELYYRLASRFRHYLIDEFQDTSTLQWHNLEKMTEEALSTGGSLFYVGDRKQAIYGFRGGEVKLFDAVKNEFAAFNVKKDVLNKNWRSHRHIVEFNNKIFSISNLKYFLKLKELHDLEKNKKDMVVFGERDLEKISSLFEQAQQSHTEQHTQGYVKIVPIDIDKKDDRDVVVREKVLGQIKELKKRFSLSDIALLTRSNAEIEQLTHWLLEEGIEVESERTSNITENLIIKEVVSFLKFLYSPIDNLSFAQFILGDVFLKATSLREDQLHEFLFEIKNRFGKEKDLTLYREFRRSFPKFWDEFLDPFFKNVDLYPLYEFVVSIYRQFQCLENFNEVQGFLMHFLELIKKQEEDHIDLGSFLEYFEELAGEDLYVPVMKRNAVRILTVHKSKGLEFPVVIIPFLGMDVKVGSQSGDQKQSYILKRDEGFLEMLRTKKKYRQFSGRHYQLYAQEYREALVTELNNVYVGLTRAKCELYAFIPKKVKASLNMINFLIPSENFECGTQVQYERSEGKESSVVQLEGGPSQDWIGFLRDEFSTKDQLTQRKARLRGDMIHEALAKVENMNGKDVDDVLRNCLNEKSSNIQRIKLIEEVKLVVQRALSEPALKLFFDFQGGAVFTEKEIVTKTGLIKRIDRLIVFDQEVHIVDFKSSREKQEEHFNQIREYMRIVFALYSGKKIKGFLIYLDECVFEEVK